MKYLIVIILCALWLLIFKSSGCELLDSPFGFVAGCMNHGINWNVFLAPSGFLLMLLLPMAIIHFFLTTMGVVIRYIHQTIRRQRK